MTTDPARILIIDDDSMIVDFIMRHLQYAGYEATGATRLTEGIARVQAETFDVVLLDVFLPDGNGLEALPDIKAAACAPEVIIITGEGDPDGAELAIRHGAWDYIEKPLSIQKLNLPLTRALEYRQSCDQMAAPRALVQTGIVGGSPEIRACLDDVARAAAGDAPVLITGETGTGKELFARAIHDNSDRREASFVVVDCAALPENLVESVLFGHRKGAFTGADSHRQGLIAQADGGTLFLDEIGELPLPVQKAFLRVLQERRFRPVGESREETSDFRLVSATHRDLEDMGRQKQFREDLLFRLRAMVIDLPSLRQRSGDIADLVHHYNRRLCERASREVKGLSPDFLEKLAEYEWPGNVRELVHTMESALMLAGEDPTLYSRHLPDHLRICMARRAVRNQAANGSPAAPGAAGGLPPTGARPGEILGFKQFRQQTLDQAEQRYLSDLVLAAQKSVETACSLSGIGKSRLYELLKKHDLSLDS